MTLADYQYSYGGLVLGDGTVYDVTELDGLEGMNVRVGDSAMPRGHGAVRGRDFLSAREVLLALELVGDQEENELALAELREAFAVAEDDDAEFVWKHPGWDERMIRCRPVVVARSVAGFAGTMLASPRIILRAADPRIYSAVEHMVTVPLYSSSGGALNLPVAQLPLNFSAGLQLEAVATNAGAADAYPVAKFYGPASGTMTSVTLNVRETGETATIVTSIAAGQILTVDFGAFVRATGEMVVSLDGATRYGDWSQPHTPLRLPPGDSTLRFTITGSATAAQAVVTWRDTWTS